jgi:SAM-dependent methyltransferase
MPKVYRKDMCLKYLSRLTPIDDFLDLCNASVLEKNVLDCGAGGKCPPLTLFRDQGYETYGIELSKRQLARAQHFCKENDIELNIVRGDMRQIPFDTRSISFVFAYESIFFLTNEDIATSMSEIERVLKPNGLCCVTFRSVDDSERRKFPEASLARTLLGSSGLTYHADGEPDMYFSRFKILQKKKRIRRTLVKGVKGKRAYIDYIARRT